MCKAVHYLSKVWPLVWSCIWFELRTLVWPLVWPCIWFNYIQNGMYAVWEPDVWLLWFYFNLAFSPSLTHLPLYIVALSSPTFSPSSLTSPLITHIPPSSLSSPTSLSLLTHLSPPFSNLPPSTLSPPLTHLASLSSCSHIHFPYSALLIEEFKDPAKVPYQYSLGPRPLYSQCWIKLFGAL